MIALSLALMTFVMWRCPETAVARTLHRWLVDAPIALAARATRRHLIFLVVALVALQPLFWVFGSVDLAVVMVWDASIYVDLVLAGSGIAVIARARLAVRAGLDRLVHRRR